MWGARTLTSIKIFRQKKSGDWKNVLNEIHEELKCRFLIN